jgi:ATP-dependent RNA helicase SUPV3L1/SUV3
VRDGSFGATTDLGAFAPNLVEAVEKHRFEPLRSVYWRNPRLAFGSVDALLESLELRPADPCLIRMRHADDQRALESLARDPDILALARRAEDVRLLWDVCPDFRNVMTEAHTRLLARIFGLLVRGDGGLPWDWVDRQVKALDTTDGDVFALLDRIAGIRTWTYVSHRAGWLADALTWQARTREIEDRLADTLHERLREQYASRGATLIARHGGNDMASQLDDNGLLLLQGIPVGRLTGFQFEPLPGEVSHTLKAAANRALRSGIDSRVAALCDSQDAAFALTAAGAILWRGAKVGRLLPGDRLLAPQAEALASDLLDPPRRERVRRRLAEWASAHIRRGLAPLIEALDAKASGPVRGLIYRLAESLGSTPRRGLRAAIDDLTRSERHELAVQGVILGRRHVWIRALLEPEALRIRATLFQVRHPGATPLPTGPESLRGGTKADPERDAACGYESLGGLLVRVDAVELLSGTAHAQARQGPLEANPSLARILRCAPEALPEVLVALGFERAGSVFVARPPRPKGRRRSG